MIEYVPHGAAPQMPLTNEERWACVKEAYRKFRNQDPPLPMYRSERDYLGSERDPYPEGFC